MCFCWPTYSLLPLFGKEQHNWTLTLIMIGLFWALATILFLIWDRASALGRSVSLIKRICRLLWYWVSLIWTQHPLLENLVSLQVACIDENDYFTRCLNCYLCTQFTCVNLSFIIKVFESIIRSCVANKIRNTTSQKIHMASVFACLALPVPNLVR